MPVFTRESMERFKEEARLKDAGPEMLAALQECVRLASRSGPEDQIAALNQIEHVAKSAIAIALADTK